MQLLVSFWCRMHNGFMYNLKSVNSFSPVTLKVLNIEVYFWEHRELLKLYIAHLKALVELLTGGWKLEHDMNRIDLTHDTVYRLNMEEDETAMNVWCKRPAVTRFLDPVLEKLTLQSENLSHVSFKKSVDFFRRLYWRRTMNRLRWAPMDLWS